MALFNNLSSRGQTKLVDISDKPIEASVIRDGVKVPPIELREDLIGDFVATDRLDGRAVQTRIVAQSIKAGTRVPRGTVVDIFMASRDLIPTDFVAGSHVGLANRSLSEVASIFLQDEVVVNGVKRSDTVEDLPPAVQAALRQAAEQAELSIVEGDPAQDNQALFRAVQAAQAYS